MKPEHENRVTPAKITELRPRQIYVFGSNEGGIHGAGAAKDAMMFGAVYGRGSGSQGFCYAIPTKPRNLQQRLPLPRIQLYVELFHRYVGENLDQTFLVTPIGCGHAGYAPKDIAPLFRGAATLGNVWLPASFWEVLDQPK